MSANPPDDIDALRAITKALEGFKQEDQNRILRWAGEKLGLSVAPPVTPSPPGSTPPPPPAPGAGTGGGTATDIKTFVAQKKPKNDLQFAAIVAYFNRFEAVEKKETISTDDLLQACRLANYTRPARPGQTLLNAVNAGLLNKADRGTFAINSVGENLVAVTLPGDGTGDTQHRPRRKPGLKRAAAKKTGAQKPAAKKPTSAKATPKKK